MKISELPTLSIDYVDGTETLPVVSNGDMVRVAAAALVEKLAAPALETVQEWADGDEPDGPGSHSAKGWALVAASSAALLKTDRPRYFKGKQVASGIAFAGMIASSGVWVDGKVFTLNQSIAVSNGLKSVGGSLSLGTEEGKFPVGSGFIDTRRPRYFKGKQVVFGQADASMRALSAVMLDGSELVGGSGGGASYDPIGAGLLPSTNIHTVGDSMMNETVRLAVRDYFGGARTVTRMNRGGYTTDQVLDLLGVEPITVTSIIGGQIPASGGVDLVLSTNPLFSGGVAIDGGTANLTISGVAGVLTTSSGAAPTLTFTRTVAGSAVAVAVGTPAILAATNGTTTLPGTDTYKRTTLLLRIGRNDLKATIQERIATRDKILKLVSYQTSLERRVILYGAYKGRAYYDGTNTLFEADGTAPSDAYYEWRAMMERDFPGIFIDGQEWARKEAIYELGLNPTANDLADMAAGCIPRQLFTAGDNVHVNTAMQSLEGGRIGKLITILGY